MYNTLIVEDDPMVAMINEHYLKKTGKFTLIKTLHNGNSTLEFLKNNSIDLIILDVFMPKTDGMTVLRHIRQNKLPIDVILVTAANDRETVEDALRLGVVDYLVKPFSNERFQIALDKYIQKSNMLKNNDIFNQQHLDSIIDKNIKQTVKEYPKGIQEKTLELIKSELQSSGSHWITGDELADYTNLSVVTVRRYMNYLIKEGVAESEASYETGGRPCMLYRLPVENE